MTSKKRKWLVLFAMCVAFFLAAVDTTIMNLAVVWIQSDFHAPLTTVQWVISGYFLSFASFIIASGKMSDHFGHRRMFAIGVSVFLVFSACGALSLNIWQLVISRILQGFGGAMFWPSVSALIMHHFDEKSRGTAMGILMGVAGFAMSVGPPFGGFLIRALSWRYILWLNVPVGIFAIIMLLLFVPKDEKHERGKIDYLAMVFIVVGLFSLFFTLNRANIVGFDKAQIIIPMCAAILFLILFIVNEVRSKHPLIDFDLLKNPVYTTSVLMRIGVGSSFFSILFVLAIYLQHILGFSPVMAGVYYLPMTIIMGIIPPFFGRIEKRVGALIPTYLGMLLIIISFAYFNLLNLTDLTFGKIFLPLFLFGLGIGLILPANMIVALRDVSKKLTGLGVGLLYTCILLSGTTLVIFSTIIIKDYGTAHAQYELRKERVALTPSQETDLRNAITGLKTSTDFAKEFSAQERPLVTQAIRYGFEQAFFLILRVCILICIITLAIFWVVQRIKHKKTLLLPDKKEDKRE